MTIKELKMLGDDIEKNRIDYVSKIEQDNVRLKRERDMYKEMAEKFAIGVQFSQKIDEAGDSKLLAVFTHNGKAFSFNVDAPTVNYYKGNPQDLLRRIVNMGLAQLVLDTVIKENENNFLSIYNNMQKLYQKGLIK